MGLNDTPKADRLHIGIFGRRNVGKSSLINALTGQDLAIVSDTPGTTADPVFKSMEMHPMGPVVFIDTAGFDDEGDLGRLRAAKTSDIIRQTDIAILVLDGTRKCSEQERAWAERLRQEAIPVVFAINKWDALGPDEKDAAMQEASMLSGNEAGDVSPVSVSAANGYGTDELRFAIERSVPESFLQGKLLSGIVKEGSLVMLVMPQDIQAPKGRLILPQVQTIRELLDRRCMVISITADELESALGELNRAPDLIITDSQCFQDVYAKKPAESGLTSFSILMAAAKGDIDAFVSGAMAIDRLKDRAEKRPVSVLIAEACTHVPLREDIGTEKIPRLLKKTFGEAAKITNVRGSDFPAKDELKNFDLIIHCGACMFNRRLVMDRIEAAKEAGTPITNYGVFLAKMSGILDKVILP